MTGLYIFKPATLRIFLGCTALMLSACDENGNFAGKDTARDIPVSSTAPIQTEVTAQDLERPDLFEVTDRGLWDGRPSLGGVWVAHPDVSDPERVIIRNTENGQSVVGALFRRERENPGPLLQLSSDAADALGILPGAPTEVSVVALRRQEVEVAPVPAAENPVVADLAAPINVESTPLDPIAGAEAAIADAENTAAAATTTASTAAATTATATTSAAATATTSAAAATAAAATAAIAATATDTATTATQTVDDSDSVAAALIADAAAALHGDSPTGKLVQIGVFSVQTNADAATNMLRANDIPTTTLAEEIGGRVVWRVISGPAEDDAAREEMIAQIKALGFVDAIAIDT